MIVKVCGMRDAQNIAEAEALGVDWIGMIFWPRSPRYVSMIHTPAGIMPDRARRDLAAGTAKHTKRVGVFVDEMPQNIITRIVNFKLDAVQLHGHETPTLLRNLKDTVAHDIKPGLQIWKAISISSAADLALCRQYEDCADMFVFDTKCTTVGGSGQQFDWDVLQAYQGQVPFLLSGGIGPEDAEQVLRFHHPQCVGIDLNSRFETEPGLKDISILKQFLDKLNSEHVYEQD